MNGFGELLHLIRSRQNASQLVKEVSISYVYLLVQRILSFFPLNLPKFPPAVLVFLAVATATPKNCLAG